MADFHSADEGLIPFNASKLWQQNRVLPVKQQENLWLGMTTGANPIKKRKKQ